MDGVSVPFRPPRRAGTAHAAMPSTARAATVAAAGQPGMAQVEHSMLPLRTQMVMLRGSQPQLAGTTHDAHAAGRRAPVPHSEPVADLTAF